ncbi:MAG: hypothetical protein ACYTG2_06925 [Planctomycetota bacterium]
MKTLHWIILAGLSIAPGVSATPRPLDDLQTKYEAKLQLEFVEYGGWVTDFDAAKARAKQEDKVLFVYFSRSYAP